MKMKLLFLFSCLISSVSIAQINSRVLVNGKISAPLGDSVEGVVVFNRSTDQGTITNEKGEFKIKAGINDRIEMVAMQYQHFIIKIDKGVVANRRIHVFLNESVNQLDEVVVTPYDLMGNVTVDVKKIDVVPSGIGEDLASETDAIVNDVVFDFTQDNQSFLENKVILEDRMINGLNFVNLFKLAFESTKEPQQKSADVDVRIRNVYSDEFFQNYLQLELNQIDEFIFFAQDNGLDMAYFQSGKELDLLQFLVVQSQLYHRQ